MRHVRAAATPIKLKIAVFAPIPRLGLVCLDEEGSATLSEAERIALANPQWALGLMLLAPPLASFAIKFGPPENFALLVLGLTMVGYLAGTSLTRPR